eukprot:TRINITY_DN39335_c0_g1_i1.p4 TRINITY_DN39335_c0_g1~~TRINITY_DN39335_c0_g1_i1.p4  ORF type:complete len:115 (-),score=31.11 TRINITY_DN39335_c0_g1_i1:326-670(-)
MLRSILGLSDAFAALLDGPYGGIVRVLYVGAFFGAGAFALLWASKQLELAEQRHQEMLESLAASRASGDEGGCASDAATTCADDAPAAEAKADAGAEVRQRRSRATDDGPAAAT